MHFSRVIYFANHAFWRLMVDLCGKTIINNQTIINDKLPQICSHKAINLLRHVLLYIIYKIDNKGASVLVNSMPKCINRFINFKKIDKNSWINILSHLLRNMFLESALRINNRIFQDAASMKLHLNMV